MVNDLHEMLVVGFCTRMDLNAVLRNVRKTQPYVTPDTIVHFSASSESSPQHFQQRSEQSGSIAPLQLGHIVDVAPMAVADQTPMETVIDMFRKLGLRTTLVTKNGRLLGIITKKDILTFMKEGEH